MNLAATAQLPQELWQPQLWQPPRRHPGRWALGLSLLVHGLLLAWLPWSGLLREEAPGDRWLEVQLQAPPAPAVEPAPTEPVPPQQPVVPQPIAESPPVVTAPQPQSPTAPPTPAEAAEAAAAQRTPPPAAAAPDVITSVPDASSAETWEWRDQLLRQSRALAPSGAVTGDATSTLPKNWTEPILPDTSSWLDPYSIPGELHQETWTETNGTVRMEVTLPNGQRMCGRATPADPLQPLSFSIPVWTTCGTVRGPAAKASTNPFRRPPPKPRSPSGQ